MCILILVAEIERGLGSLHKARESIRQAYADMDPEVAESLRQDTDAVIDIGVSFDGTWQKRGFTSHYSVGVCIDILTGLVIDYEILSSYCHACACKNSVLKAGEISEEEFDSWKEGHKADCAKNFAGSSKAMEQEAAKRMWGRSVSRHQLRYTEMLSDGDSSAFRQVVELKPYPGQEVTKLECINHAHKRMGTALRKISVGKKLGGKGSGKLTAKKCKSLQNFYRGAILNNQGNIEGMKSEIWAGLLHCMSTDEVPLHNRCNPQWCFFRRAEDNGETPDSHSLHSKNHLSREVGQTLVPIYHRTSSDSLLQKMQHGGTQNNNECLNSVIWARCPKTVFVGRNRVEAAVSMAISSFNEGASAILNVMANLWLESTTITLNTIREADMLRVTKANAILSPQTKGKRKHESNERKVKRHQQEQEEGATYGAGMEM